MQQFFLLCTMLILAHEAFSEELYGSQNSKNISKGASRFSPESKFSNFDGPMFSVPHFRQSSAQGPLFVHRRGKKPSPWNIQRFAKARRSRRRRLRKRKAKLGSSAFLECSQNSCSEPRSNLFRVAFSSRNPRIPNQYVMYLYPVQSRPKNKSDFFRNLRFPQGQYSTALGNKNKRSAISSNSRREISTEPNYHFNQKLNPDIADSISSEETFERNEKQHLNSKSGEERQPSLTFPSGLPSFLRGTPPKVPPRRPQAEASPLRTERERKAPPEEENRKEKRKTSQREIGKLKEMLEDLESLLKVETEDDAILEERQQLEEHLENELRHNKTKHNDTLSLKEKIDSIAIPLLTQISEDLGKITSNMTLSSSSWNTSESSTSTTSQSTDATAKSKVKSKKPNERCSADGTWTSSVLGFDMVFTTMPNLMLKVKIKSGNNSIINNRWSLQGLSLSKRGGPVMLAGVYPQRRKMASFLGQCKMCQDQDMIFGSWTIFTCMRRFTDLWRAAETKLDILKKKKA